MKIQTFLFLAVFLLCAAFVQDTEGAFGVLPSGKRVLAREVCIFGIKDKINYIRTVLHPFPLVHNSRVTNSF